MQDLKTLPERIRRDDPRFGDSCGHRYEGKNYELFWSDYPRKEEAPVVYLLNADKTEGSRVYDEELEKAVAEDWWIKAEVRIQNIGRDEVYFPHAVPPTPGVPSGLFAGAMMELSGGKNPLLPDAPEPEVWTCPNCGQTGNTTKFCTECGTKRP